MTTIILRPATEADLPSMVAMDQEIFGAYGANEELAVICARLAVFPTGCVVLEEKAAKHALPVFVGYLTSEKWKQMREPALDEDPTQTHEPDGTLLNITTLVVGRPFQGRGLGALLLEHVLTIARQERCTQIVLETAHAQRFYRQHGFVQVAERQQRGIVLAVMHLQICP
jgi:ribosomal protein S18 acetylase RimI-like enzyme